MPIFKDMELENFAFQNEEEIDLYMEYLKTLEQLSEFNVLKLVLAYHYKHEKKNHWIQMHRQSGGPFQKLPNWQPVVMGRKQTCERSSAL